MDFFDTAEGRNAMLGIVDGMEEIANQLKALNGRARGAQALDAKGHACLMGPIHAEGFTQERALIFKPEDSCTPYVAVRGYEPDTGEWSSGSYHNDLVEAFEDAREDCMLAMWLSKDDVRRAIAFVGASNLDEDVAAVFTDRFRKQLEGKVRAMIAEEIESRAKELLDFGMIEPF